ncbi:hypothetical protein ABPG74_017090 [Tetrahymena malaccensis]
MIEQIKQKGNLKLVFQKNQKLVDDLKNEQKVDQIILCQQLMKYNEFLYNNYIKYYFRIRMWNGMYDEHFINIQSIASQILHQSFVSNPQNQELIKGIPAQIIKYDIQKLFGIISPDAILYDNVQQTKREQIQKELIKQYTDIQFLDYIQSIKIFEGESYQQLQVINHLSKTCNFLTSIPSGIMKQFLQDILIFFCFVITAFIYCYFKEQAEQNSPKKVILCNLCKIKGFFSDSKDQKLCQKCQNQNKENNQSFLKSIWNKIKSPN